MSDADSHPFSLHRTTRRLSAFRCSAPLTACQEFSARLPLSAPGRLHCRSPRSACSAGLMRMGQVDGTGPQTWHRFPSHHGSRWKLGTYFAASVWPHPLLQQPDLARIVARQPIAAMATTARAGACVSWSLRLVYLGLLRKLPIDPPQKPLAPLYGLARTGNRLSQCGSAL